MICGPIGERPRQEQHIRSLHNCHDNAVGSTEREREREAAGGEAQAKPIKNGVRGRNASETDCAP